MSAIIAPRAFSLPTLSTAADLAKLAAAPAPGPAPAPSAPSDTSVLSRANRRGMETAADWNDKVGTVVGGTLGLGVLIPAVYGGVIGGVIAGGIAGLGFGPAAAIMSGAHGLSFLGAILHSGGLAAKAATVLGTATGTVGGFVVGQKVGRGVAAVPIALVAYPIGFAKGLVSKDDPYQDPNPAPKPAPSPREKAGAVTKAAQAFLGGAGLITGAVGGGVLGAGIGSGAALTHGFLASNLTWSALSAGGMTGAVIGAAALGVVSAAGGYMIATGIAHLANKARGGH
jgi:hypothetical protein